MRDRRSRYWKGPETDRWQHRYRELMALKRARP
jgi:hypothetical protein